MADLRLWRMLQAAATVSCVEKLECQRARRNLLRNRTLRYGLELAGALSCRALFKDAFEDSVGRKKYKTAEQERKP